MIQSCRPFWIQVTDVEIKYATHKCQIYFDLLLPRTIVGGMTNNAAKTFLIFNIH